MHLRATMGEAAFFGASLLSTIGNALHRIDVRTATASAAGASALVLSERIPSHTKGLCIDGDVAQIVKVVSVNGRTVVIDRPLLLSHAAGVKVKVLL